MRWHDISDNTQNVILNILYRDGERKQTCVLRLVNHQFSQSLGNVVATYSMSYDEAIKHIDDEECLLNTVDWMLAREIENREEYKYPSITFLASYLAASKEFVRLLQWIYDHKREHMDPTSLKYHTLNLCKTSEDHEGKLRVEVPHWYLKTFGPEIFQNDNLQYYDVYAVRYGNITILKWLVQNGVAFKRQNNREEGYTDELDEVETNGNIDPDLVGYFWNMWLEEACAQGYVEIAEWLIRKGVPLTNDVVLATIKTSKNSEQLIKSFYLNGWRSRECAKQDYKDSVYACDSKDNGECNFLWHIWQENRILRRRQLDRERKRRMRSICIK